MLEHPAGLEEVVRKRVQEQGYDYMRTLITSKGADPRSVWEVFRRYHTSDAASKKSSEKIGITNSYPNLPEPHPAYSQFRIAHDSKDRLIQKFKEKGYRNICFLGCPILASEFAEKGFEGSVILDVDASTLKALNCPANVVNYDVADEVPKELRNRFSVIISDPPWYYDDIKLFIKRSAELAKVNGSIYTSIPGIFTKADIQERLDFQKWLSDSNLLLSKMGPVIGYEVPAFEYMAYLDIPDFTGEQWRGGYLIKLKNLLVSCPKAEVPKRTEWHEYSIRGKRVFLRKKEDDERPSKVSALYEDGSLILNTVSRRNPLIPQIDIWSSRNAVMHIDSGFNQVREVLGGISWDYNAGYGDARDKTADLLRRLIEV